MKDIALITVTYNAHFKLVEKYLQSIDEFLLDKETPLCFIISNQEIIKFKVLIQPYKKLNIRIAFFEDLLEKFNVEKSPRELMEEYGKYTYQSLKKYYGMLYFGYDQYLVLDSEILLVKKTNMHELFEQYFSNPFICYTRLRNRIKTSYFMESIVRNTYYLLDTKDDKWMLEFFEWFYDINILKDLLSLHGSPYTMAKKLKFIVGIYDYDDMMETCIYHSFIDMHTERYGYHSYDMDDAVKESLGVNDFLFVKKKLSQKLDGNGGLLEYVSIYINRKNYKHLSELFLKYKLKIIRCEYYEETAINMKKFLNIVKPNILAVSQNHPFAGANSFKNLLVYSKKIENCKSKIHVYGGFLILMYRKIKKIILLIYYTIKIIFVVFFTLLVKIRL